MNEKSEAVVIEHPDEHLSVLKYIVGFLCSVGLTLAAYLVTTHHLYGKNLFTVLLAVLAVVQFVVQMVFFLHVGTERGPRWKLAVMIMMLSVVLILVFGSICIMNNLNYRMTPEQMQRYLNSQDSL